ncbi:uncharacterized protein LOC110023145 isoform X2 [Phalaenopsis equestris]|uniref:uncharacterized protein LOC110023145 isoform X2 n=1 Tax=Phalaenopsis equestris TaxID=78828 RepID=UPI0009E3412B|nr:uncharacterized protein LOC110023145 isoform X2 [Phalaenopsis equestris]
MEAAGGVDMPEAGRANAIALDFSAGEPSSSTPTKVPRRIRRRLLECRSSPPSSVDEIEAKLKEAELRRRQFHEWLSSKARPKPRSPSWSSQEDLGQRLEAKLNAAEQKRLNLLANAQMRLARLDELRQAAKCGAEMRFEKQREELGSRVEFRVQQAEANRMQLHKAHMQKRAAVKERKARSLLQRTARENTYKESIRSAISQKRSAAERKRMVLLEAEKSRAQARVMQARKIAKIVCCRRESESRKKKEQLESRLQRAKRQRAELLQMKSNAHNTAAHVNLMKYGDLLSRKLAWCWRQFVKCKRTTFALAQEYMTLGINEKSVKSMPFEQLAHLIESTTTLQTARALLDRFESRFFLHQPSSSSSPENIDHLLKRLSSPRKRSPPGKRSRAKDDKCSSGVSSSGAGKLSRYPVRAVLCAYMILGHPNAVFSEHGEREVALSRAAVDLTREFELLIKVILDGANSVLMLKHPSPGVLFHDSETHKQSATQSQSEKTFKNQLSIFDAVWRSYLYCFVVWKVKDARLLEDDLVRAACQLELSMMQTCKLTFEGETHNLSYDMRAIQKQVTEDQKLIREKVEHLCGNEGLRRMERALSETRSKFFEAKESVTHLIGHVAQLSSPNSSSSSVKPVVDPASKEHFIEKKGSSSNAARSLFGRTSSQTFPCSQSNSTVAGQLASENELLVNEIVHNGQISFANDLDIATTYRSDIKEKVKVTMEKAFWDGVVQSMKEDSPDYDRIIGLVKEVRDELSEMAPLSWKQEIHDSIDIDILSQVMKLGTRDRDYLGRILGYALLTLRRLSAPANENDLKKSHEKLLNELASKAHSDDEIESSFAISMIKGLRFVLDQIQTLKKEISKARIQLIEPIIKGSAGLEYLQNAFHDRYGLSSTAADTLPLTKLWLSPLKIIADEEWSEYVDSISLLPESHTLPLPPTSLRTGGKMHQAHMQSLHPTEKPVDGQLKCSGEKLDVLLRLGLLRLASSVEGLITDTIPETLKLNVLRLRSLQSQLQQIIVISTSMLVLRQVVISDGLSLSLSELDSIISTSVNNLFKLLDNVPDVSMEEIVETIANSFPEEDKLPSRKQLMARLVIKSLENDDPVFAKVSRSIYLATRAILFAGNGPRGCRLAQGILQKVGAAMLLDRVVRVAEVLIIMATVSLQVHGSWYQFLV